MTPRTWRDALADPDPADWRFLTVRQPWAWAIAHAGKSPENRTQTWSYRGPLLIHAGASVDRYALNDPRIRSAHARLAAAGPVRQPAAVVSQLVAVANLVDVHDASPACPESCALWGETMPRTTHLVLDDVLAIDGPTMAGGLGLRRLPAPSLLLALSAIHRALEANP